MIVIGTAGHIDHGKSAIIKRLTGTDPDRLPEEKERGMTIDLGFAFKKTKSGKDIAFVDVPGHERFVKNMIAGAGGIDVVMLIIAADDGWMPQSEEHFQIIRLLGIKSGMVVINKIDLAETAWIGLLKDDIKQRVSGTFLEDAPIFEVSAINGQGFDGLISYLDNIHSKILTKQNTGHARLYIDRSFIRQGIGQVVTGTLKGGSFSVGQNVTVWPSNFDSKLRTIQSHGEDVEVAYPGYRTAISITGADKDILVRGGAVVAEKDLSFYKENSILSLSVELLKDAPVKLSDRRKVLLITGTTEVEGEIRIYRDKILSSSQNGIIFFKPDEPIFSLIGDRYIMRLPTPMVTIGGGKILDHHKQFIKKRDSDKYEYLLKRVSDNLSELIISELEKNILISHDEFLNHADFSHEIIYDEIKKLVSEKIIGRVDNYIYLSKKLTEEITKFIICINEYLAGKPHLKGLTLEELIRQGGYSQAAGEALVNYLLKQEKLIKSGDKYNLEGRGMSLKGDIKRAYDQIIRELNDNPFTPPKLSDLAQTGKIYRDAIKYIIDSDEGYKCGSEFIFLTSAWDEIIRFIKETLNKNARCQVSDLKDKFDISRKYTIPILEETDRLQITKREGDIRIKGAKFES